MIRRRWSAGARPLGTSLSLALLAASGDWYVDIQAPDCATGTGTALSPFCHIMEAVDAASDGDTIHIAPGTYVENLTLPKDLELVGSQGERVTIVDGGAMDRVVSIDPGTTTVLTGLTFTNGLSATGAGIHVGFGAPARLTLRSSTVSGNLASHPYFASGGGIHASSNSSVELIEATIRLNRSLSQPFPFYGQAEGGGIANSGTMTLERCVVSANDVSADFANGGGIWSSGTLRVEDSEVTLNNLPTDGNAIFTSGPLALIHTTVSGNRGPGPGPAIRSVGGANTLVRGSILWGNRVPVVSGTATIYHSDVEGGWSGPGAWNIDADPLFVSPPAADLSLDPASPCIDAADPSLSPGGLDLGGGPRLLDGDLDRRMVVDMGAHEFGHVHIEVSGEATPGGTLRIETSGTAGMGVLLAIASAPGETLVRPIGPAFFDLGAPWRSLPLGTIPAAIDLTIPPALPTPSPAIFQALAVGTALPSGRLPANVSNPVTVTIE